MPVILPFTLIYVERHLEQNAYILNCSQAFFF